MPNKKSRNLRNKPIITTFYLCNSCKNWFHYKDYNIVAFLCNSCKKMKDKQVKNSKKEKRK